MPRGLLYGAKGCSLGDVRDYMVRATGIAFGSFESVYRGGEYFRGSLERGEMLTLQLNREFSDDIAEEDFPDRDVLLYVDRTTREDALNELICGEGSPLELLRAQIVV